jgi:hypothetical protein
LECGAIIHQLGNIIPDATRHFLIPDFRKILCQRLFMPDQIINIIQMDKTVSECSGHLGIYLGNDQRGIFQSGFGHINGNT